MSRLSVGFVAGAHGIRGGLRIKLFDEDSQRLAVGVSVAFTDEQGSDLGEYEIEKVGAVPGKPGRFRVHLQGVTKRDDAERFVGAKVHLDRAVLPPLKDDEFYLADAVGLPVVRDREPTELGKVVGLSTNGAQDLLEIEWTAPSGETHSWLLPVLPGFVRDVDAQRVLVDVPEGMLPEELEP